MFVSIPAIFDITPPALYITTCQTDEISRPAGMSSFSLYRVETFHHGVLNIHQSAMDRRGIFFSCCFRCMHINLCILPSCSPSPRQCLSTQYDQVFTLWLPGD